MIAVHYCTVPFLAQRNASHRSTRQICALCILGLSRGNPRLQLAKAFHRDDMVDLTRFATAQSALGAHRLETGIREIPRRVQITMMAFNLAYQLSGSVLRSQPPLQSGKGTGRCFDRETHASFVVGLFQHVNVFAYLSEHPFLAVGNHEIDLCHVV
jgi:hypothetical protein